MLESRPLGIRMVRVRFLHGNYGSRDDPDDEDAAASGSSGLRARLTGKRVLVCVGAGGVGKTTTSAALALGLALRGQKVAVVTIDPAKRLAAALGLEELSGEPTPHRAQDARGGGRGDEGRAVGDDARREADVR